MNLHSLNFSCKDIVYRRRGHGEEHRETRLEVYITISVINYHQSVNLSLLKDGIYKSSYELLITKSIKEIGLWSTITFCHNDTTLLMYHDLRFSE